MPDTPKWRRSLEPILSIGSYPGEPEIRRGGRRVLIVATIIANFFSMPQVFGDLGTPQLVAALMMRRVEIGDDQNSHVDGCSPSANSR